MDSPAPPERPPNADVLSFGRIEVRVAERRVLVDSRPVILGSRAFDLLITLVEHRERVVAKSELLDTAWHGLVVEENNLSVQVAALRKVLGAHAIATIPGLGYRFTAAPDERPASPVPTAEASPKHPSGSSLRTNLPEVLPALIGRDDELTALAALLDKHPLITITGAGGMGKTRVPEHLLHERRQRYAHGVAWVELAGLSQRTLLAGAIAGALGLQTGAQNPLVGLVAALVPLDMLIWPGQRGAPHWRRGRYRQRHQGACPSYFLGSGSMAQGRVAPGSTP